LIARAIVSDPELLLLDEPTANVDTEAEQQIYSLLNKWRGEKTILMVTHDLRSIVEQVDKVLCVEQKVTSIEPKKICEHFAIGLYHHPLIASECCLPNEKGNPPQ
jgi:zinc transport system ATP-binding protein